jgi:hypothetical protein
MTPTSKKRRRSPQRGSALLVTLILVGALLAGSAVLVVLQMSSNRSTDLTRNGLSSLYCAEAGLAAARPVVMSQYPSWGSALQAEYPNYNTEPPFLTGINHSLDGGSGSDFVVWLRDNDDEIAAGGSANGSADIDLKVFLVSTCIKYPDNPKQVEELVQYTGGGQCYQSQLGGCGGNGNSN